MISEDSLFPYQETGAEFLSKHRVALLADEMGLGKSAQAITACDLLSAKRVLVLCPAVARENWRREFELWSETPREFQIINDRSTPVSPTKSIICSYDLADPLKIPGKFDVLIMDEAHYLKGVATKRTKAVIGRGGFVHRASFRWALTGTPAPNHYGELWPLLFTYGVTSLPYLQFVDRYCTTMDSPHGLRITGSKESNAPELKALLSRVMLRRKKSEVMKDLPPISYQSIIVPEGPVDVDLEPSFTQYVIPKDLKKELFEKLDRERDILAHLLGTTGFSRDGLKGMEALSSSISTLRRYIGLQKVQAVADLVDAELTDFAYHKIVIFAVHRDVIEGLRTRLRKHGVVTLYGGHDPQKAMRNVDSFQNNPRTRIFIGNIVAAGTAITLTAAHNVLFIEQDWVPGNNAQAAMRCHRIGQTNPVVVRFCGLAGTLDERVSYLLKKKTKELTKLFDNETKNILEKSDLPESKPDANSRTSDVVQNETKSSLT